MIKRLNKTIRKGHAIWKIITANEPPTVFLRTEEQTLKGQIEKAIVDSWRAPKSMEEEDFFRKMIENIYSAVTNKSGNSIVDIVNKNFSGPFAHAAWFYSFLCGFVCHWEFTVRLFADRYGVRITKNKDEKSKKEKTMGVVAFRDISEILKELGDKNKNVFKLQLEQLSTLRNALIHGNFQQLRRYANYAGVTISRNHKGNVFMFNPADISQGINLSDVHDDDVRENTDVFSWFIEGTNSQLLRDIFNKFETSLAHINILVTFKSLSYNEREACFNKLMTGNKLSADEEKSYFEVMKISRIVDPNFFDKLYKCFTKLS